MSLPADHFAPFVCYMLHSPFVRSVAVLLATGLLLVPNARAQEIRDSIEVSEKLKPEIGFAIGAAFPQGDFTRNVNTGLDGYLRISYPLKSDKGLSLMATGGGADFKSENQGGILDTLGNLTSASQEMDFRSAYAHVGLQWTGSWQEFALRPRLGISAGAHWTETKSSVTVAGVLVDSLTQTTQATRPGIRFQLASDWVLRNNVGLTLEFKLDHVWNVAQFEVSNGSEEADVVEKSVSYISFLVGLAIPL
jgi:hypothetical protein